MTPGEMAVERVDEISVEPLFDSAWVGEEARRLSNWGRWGADDQIGAWNTVTPEKIVEAADCVKKGTVFSLALPFGTGGPNTGEIPNRLNALHFMTLSGSDVAAGAQRHFAGDAGFAEDWVLMNTSASTQWDGFPHVFRDGRMYNDVPASAVPSSGARRNSIAELRDRIVTRGVLLDVPRQQGTPWLKPGYAIEPEDLDSCCAAIGVEVGAGDAVLIRTGALARVRARGSWGDYAGTGAAAGLGLRTGAWFAERDVAAVAADNWSFEVLPWATADTIGPLHQIILCHCGITIGEMFDLEALAEDCAADGVYEFMLVAPPLPVEGAVNTPTNPQAIK
jgi:kynurenine formamidase